MSIENREVAVGTRLVARHKKQDRTCEVVETPDGLRYRLDDATEHRSPSSAGKAAMEGVACNGWRFWSVEGTEPKPKAEKPAKEKNEPTAKKPAKTTPKKAKGAKKPKAVNSGDLGLAYGCGVCPEMFATMKEATAHAMTHTS